MRKAPKPGSYLSATVQCCYDNSVVDVGSFYMQMASEADPQTALTSVAEHLSLGEYSALVHAYSISFADAVCVVRKRGQFMHDAAQGTGTMGAIVGLDG